MTQPCVLCGATEAKEVFRFLKPHSHPATGKHTEDLFGHAGTLVRCVTCGLVRQDAPLAAPYGGAEDEEYLSEEAGNRRTFRDVLDRIERHRPPGRLLDIGCGPGLLLDEARSRGWETVGIEPSTWAVGEATRRGLDVRHGTLDVVDLEPGSFDAVVAADVIEHVPDPVGFSQKIHSLLKPGGIVFIATPNVDSVVARVLRRWWWSVIPNHIWLFSLRTLIALLTKADLKPVLVTTHPKTFSIAYYAGRLGGYSKSLGRLGRALSSLLKSRLITPNFRDRIAVVAQRPPGFK